MEPEAQPPEPPPGIPARTKRQAMDWSLVLASQNISATILRLPAGGGWWLQMEPSEITRAEEALRLYQVENRGGDWRAELSRMELQIHPGAIVVCALLAVMHALASYRFPLLRGVGQMDSELVFTGDWWRLFTAVSLHSDLGHLMSNLVFGCLMLGLAMGRYGGGVALLAAWMAGAAGNAAGLALYPYPYKGVGASGMMMGALGLLAIHTLGLWRRNRRAAGYVGACIFSGICLFVLFGTDPSSDIIAHAGGFAMGLFAGWLIGGLEHPPGRAANLAALMTTWALWCGTWFLAWGAR